MAGQMGRARSNDIVPNGHIVPLANMTLPNSITLSTYKTCGSASVLNLLCSGTWQASTFGSPTVGVAHAADQEVYLPVNGKDTIYFGGSGTMQITLYTLINNADL